MVTFNVGPPVLVTVKVPPFVVVECGMLMANEVGATAIAGGFLQIEDHRSPTAKDEVGLGRIAGVLVLFVLPA